MSVDLFAFQPYVTLATYTEKGAFQEKTRRLLQKAQAQRKSDQALFCFPEYFCGFLAAEGKGKLVRWARTMEEALGLVALSELPRLLLFMAREKIGDIKKAFLVYEGRKLFFFLRAFFSSCAQEFQGYVLLGSALLPDLRFSKKASVFNTSLAFSPEGKIVNWVKKVNLVPGMEDLLHLDAGELESVSPFTTPFGKVGVAICYDGFCAPHTRYEKFKDVPAFLDQQGATILVQPSANPWPWDELWAYGGPQESLLRKEQWEKEGCVKALHRFSSIQVYINPLLHGKLLDLSFDGLSSIWVKEGSWVKKVVAKRARASQEILVCHL